MMIRMFFFLGLLFSALSARGQTTFTGQITGSWIQPMGSPSLVSSVTNADSATFSHGEVKLDLGNGEFLEAGTANRMIFTPASFDQKPEWTWFPIGVLQSLNGTTFYDSEASQITLHLEVNLASPITKKIEIDLLLLLTSTENSSDQSSSADIVAFKEPFRPTFIVGNERYVMEFSWSLINPTSGFTTGSSLAAYEGAEALAELRVRIFKDTSYTAFDVWLAQQGFTAGIAQGATDDPDQDGITNEEEFVFGGNPLKSDSQRLRPVISQGADNLLILFQQTDESQPLKKIYLEFSEDLIMWRRLAIPQREGVSVIDNIILRFRENAEQPDEFSAVIPRDQQSNLFVRLKVSY